MTDKREIAALCERLRTMYSHRGDGIPTQYVNPDGPAAADLIERLYAELAAIIHRCDATAIPGAPSLVPASARAALSRARGESPPAKTLVVYEDGMPG